MSVHSLAKMSGHNTVNTMEDREGRQRVSETNTVKNFSLQSKVMVGYP